MAFGFYLNMEALSLKIARKHIDEMVENFRYMEDCFLDDEKLILNLENGFVALTQLCCFYESFLNTSTMEKLILQ